MSQNKKNRGAVSMFDIQPKGNLVDLKSSLNKKNEDFKAQEELSLVEALREWEREELLKKEEARLVQKKLQLEIQKEAGFFRVVHFDQDSENELPLKIVSERIYNPLVAKPQEREEIVEDLNLAEEMETEQEKEARIREKIEKEARLEKALIQEKERAVAQEKRLQRKKEIENKLSRIKESLMAGASPEKNKVNFFKPALAFSSVCLVVFGLFFALRFASYGFQIKDQAVVKGASIVADLEEVKTNFQEKNFSQISVQFQNIQKEIESINRDLGTMNGGMPGLLSKIPFVSKYGSAKNVLKAGEEIAAGVIPLGQAMEEFSKLGNPLDFDENQEISLGKFFLSLEKKMKLAESHFEKASKHLDQVDEKDLPENYQDKVKVLKETLPEITELLSEFNQKQVIFKDLLGYNGPRKYLFLFQNNHEIRATGGFIGSYGVLKVHNGEVKDLFVDGIFNPDGQLTARVVPPGPIQKISTNWSTHDANWFPDFPTSAEKIAWFYEKTGGPTVDGIITLTPTVLENLLEITGPIEMSEYETVVNKDNFIEATQYEVEEDYDKEENRPKKFIADLTPEVLDRIFSGDSLSKLPQTIKVFSKSLEGKHILIYLDNPEIQEMISGLGWSGEVLENSKDYLMVVNSNINGYKTDGVIDQEIKHEIEIANDGSILDTVTITRKHNGGSLEYDWWNKVNANYMRVYVPQGSELLEASGYTREIVEEPVDYDKLGFIRDDLVDELEGKIEIDEKSGTEIWDEAGKTVFANWVYVSPQESVKVSYKYKLPFKVDLDEDGEETDVFSVLYQKQSGMNTSVLETVLNLAEGQEIFWKYPETLVDEKGSWIYNGDLEGDRFLGIVVK